MTPMMYLSVRYQYCPQESCPFYGRTLQGNVVVHSRKNQRFKCNSCGKTWVAYRDEVRYGLRTDFEKVKLALTLAKHGDSVRMVAEKVEVSPSTVQRWKTRMINLFLCKDL